MPERIFLTYTNATAMPYQGSVLGHHIVLNYIDSKGDHHILQAIPERKFEHNAEKVGAFVREEILSNGASNRDSPFQRLKVDPDKIDSDGAISRPHTMIAEGNDLRSQWDQMKRFGEHVNSTGYEYRPYSQNSNSFAAGALKHAGFFGPGTAFPETFDRLLAVDPMSGVTHPVRVPGFDQRLTNPLNETGTRLNELATPLVSAKAFPESERKNSFDQRFGNWVSSPAASAPEGMQRPSWLPKIDKKAEATASKPERYLGRRVAGKPDASTFDAGAPAVPLVPSDENFLPGRPVSFNDRFGNWISSPPVSAPRGPYQPAPQASRPRGIVSGEPMPDWPFPPPFFDFPNKSAARSEDSEDWLARLLRAVGRY
jgi:hypothetical protein